MGLLSTSKSSLSRFGTSGATMLSMAIAETALKYGATMVDINMEDNWFMRMFREKANKIIIRQTATETLKTTKACVLNANSLYHN